MNSHDRGGLMPWLALLTIWIVWGSTYLGMSAAVETIPPFLMTGARFLLAAPVMFMFAVPAWRRGEISVTPQQLMWAGAVGLLLLLGGTGLAALAQKDIDSSLAALILSLAPILMSLFTSLKTGVAPQKKIIGALVVGLIGIGIMVGGPGSAHIPAMPILILAGSSLCWTYGTVQSRFVPMPSHSFLSSGTQMLVGGIGLWLLAALLGEWNELDIDSISTRSWIGFTWLVVAGSLLAYNAYIYANKTLPIEVVSTYSYVNPVIAVALGATLDNDPVGPNVLIGGSVILLAVVFIVSGHKRRTHTIQAE